MTARQGSSITRIGQSVFTGATVADIPVTAKGLLGQTGDLFQARNSADVVLARIDAAGQYIEGGRRISRLTSRLAGNATSGSTTYSTTGMALSLLGSTAYSIKAAGLYQTAATTTGIGFTLAANPAALTATTLIAWWTIFGLSATTFTHLSQTALGTALAKSTGVTAATTNYGWQMEGLILTNVAGTLDLQFATEVAASNAIVLAGSYLEARELA